MVLQHRERSRGCSGEEDGSYTDGTVCRDGGNLPYVPFQGWKYAGAGEKEAERP